MPLKKSKTDAARQSNIREMISAGHPPEQAVAAAYRTQRAAENKHHATQHTKASRRVAARFSRGS